VANVAVDVEWMLHRATTTEFIQESGLWLGALQLQVANVAVDVEWMLHRATTTELIQESGLWLGASMSHRR
jgi:hypothetical protein